MSVKKFKIDVYGRTLFVCTGSTSKEMSKYFSHCIDMQEMSYCDAFVFKCFNKKDSDIEEYVVWFENDVAKTVSTQAHEAVHVADLICHDLLITHNYLDECYAYLVGFIVKCINSTIKY